MKDNFNGKGNSVLRWFSVIAMALICTSAVWAYQTLTTGGLTGTIQDPSGAVIPHASVTLTSVESGAVRKLISNVQGVYRFSQLEPGQYRLHVTANGFKSANVGPITVVLSGVTTDNVSLQVGSMVQMIQVQGAPPLIQTSNPNTTTTLTAGTLMTLPNPGEDLTYAALVAPGVSMNSTAGYGNFEVNGLPATSINFSIDGMYYNDPFLNLNNSGATNMSLGLNGIAEMSENSTSYSVDQGHLGAMQINYITKSGTNQWHGNAYETWNGASLNASDYFLNMEGQPKSSDVVNVFGASLGGPILHNKLFFFVDLEGNRIAIPDVESGITYPTAAFEQYVLNDTLPKGGTDTLTGQTYPAEPQEVPFYKQMFSLYGNQTGTPLPMVGCPLGTGGDGCAVQRTFTVAGDTHETLLNSKVNLNVNNSNITWYEFRYDRGVQATYLDPIDTAFSVISTQPEVQGAVGWTHTFSPNLVMQFNPGFDWYTAIFEPPDIAKTLSTFSVVYPESVAGEAMFSPVGGEDFVWPQGRNVTTYQLIDNLTWSHGTHEFKFGGNMFRVLVSDHDYGFYNTPFEGVTDLPQFMFGVSAYTQESFPVSLSEPIGYVNLDTYAMDTWKATRKLTFTYGLRATWDSTPVDQHNLVSTLAGPFSTITTNPDTAVNSVIQTGKSLLYSESPLIQWQPRASLAYQVRPNTVFRAGGGIFSDVFPATIADNLTENTPYDNTFITGILGLPGGIGAAPGAASVSAVGTAIASNQAVVAGFHSGVVSCAAANAPSNCIPASSFTSLPGKFINYPYSLQWSAQIEQQFGQSWAVSLGYVGTRGVDYPYFEQANGYQDVCAGCFAPYPYATSAPNPIFGAVTQLEVGSNSNYNGLQASVTKRMGNGLQFSANYTYSKCMDEISNGGFLGLGNADADNILNPLPGDLSRNYGPCDYNLPNSFNANYVYQLPFRSQNGFLSKLVDGWQVSGTFFIHSGYPFSVYSSSYSANGNGIENIATAGTGFPETGPEFANRIPGQSAYEKQNIPGVTQPGEIQWLNPNAFQSVVDPTTGACYGGDNATNCQFGDMGRNSLVGPGFFWSDFSIGKNFKLSERFTFRLEGDFYNVFNHPNFEVPDNNTPAGKSSQTAGIPSEPSTLTSFGAIDSEVSPATGLLGSFLGGDSAVRMIALHGALSW